MKGQIGEYELAAFNTKYFAFIGANKTNRNYLMGVMEDMNVNERYVLCNLTK